VKEYHCWCRFPENPLVWLCISTAPLALTSFMRLMLQAEAEVEEDRIPPKQQSKPKKQNKKQRQKERRRVGEGGHDRITRASWR
jgi:hypothetical protein